MLCCVCVSLFFNMCLTDSSFGKFNTTQMRMMLYRSSPMPAEWVEKAIKGFKGTEIVQGYGLTETSPILTFLDWEDHKNAIDTGELEILRAAGRPVIGLEMRIKDEGGHDLPTGEVGEVAARGPNVMLGYWRQKELSDKALLNGWMHTGDGGYMNEDGYVIPILHNGPGWLHTVVYNSPEPKYWMQIILNPKEGGWEELIENVKNGNIYQWEEKVIWEVIGD